MIEVAGLMIHEEVEEIVLALKQELSSSGRRLLADIKPLGDNLMISCPIHSEGQERKASCGITTKRKRTMDGKEVPVGTVHCFACGFRANFAEFISKCFNYDDAGMYGIQWLMVNYGAIEPEQRKPLDLNMERSISQPSFISEQELASYRFTHSYMYQRKLTDEVIERFDVGYDKATDSITFPVKDLDGKVAFIQRRAISSKNFLNQSSIQKGSIVYGLYEAMEAGKRDVFVCESIIDALTLWAVGKPSVALMGAVPSERQLELLTNGYLRSITLALDNDEAGKKGAEQIRKRKKEGIIIYEAILPAGVKDVNDCTIQQLHSLQVKHFVS